MSPSRLARARGVRGRQRTLAVAFALALISAAGSAAAADPEATPPGTTPPPSAPKYPTQATAAAPAGEGFSFGSYGRVSTASDLRGGSGREANITAFGSRLDLPTYAEIQLERRDRWPNKGGVGSVSTNVVFTMAFAGPLFHETGVFDAKTAVRNLYADTKGIFHKGFSAWIGSRMYRGDDVYLLNFWPLDNLNMVGGGVKLALDTTSEEATTLALAVGLGRAQDPFSFQTIPSSSPSGFGATQVTFLDRPRLVTSLKAQHLTFLKQGKEGEGAKPGFKVALYGEQHSMGRGVRLNESNLREELPSERGTMIGGQLGFFTGERDVFVNLFLRYATGLAAYGDKTVPSALNLDKSTSGAHETQLALSANYEKGPLGVLVGGYFRAFKDASGNAYSRNTFNEGSLVVRPQVWLGDHFGLALEGNYQSLATAAVRDDGSRERASLWRFGVVPFLSPAGRGSFTRPHFQLIYLYTSRDAGARLRYAPDDKFARRQNEHYLGFTVEWWFNSSYR
ncbi:MAG: carbohydrate porin [Deltaproteobacteria bacterium]|nr:carbohydrate porin [Deltaproteobacteria bacterium]